MGVQCDPLSVCVLVVSFGYCRPNIDYFMYELLGGDLCGLFQDFCSCTAPEKTSGLPATARTAITSNGSEYSKEQTICFEHQIFFSERVLFMSGIFGLLFATLLHLDRH